MTVRGKRAGDAFWTKMCGFWPQLLRPTGIALSPLGRCPRKSQPNSLALDRGVVGASFLLYPETTSHLLETNPATLEKCGVWESIFPKEVCWSPSHGKGVGDKGSPGPEPSLCWTQPRAGAPRASGSTGQTLEFICREGPCGQRLVLSLGLQTRRVVWVQGDAELATEPLPPHLSCESCTDTCWISLSPWAP